jgi:hypothetical protein
MNRKERTFEILRTIWNLTIYSLLFGSMLGGLLGVAISLATDWPDTFVIGCGIAGVPLLFGWMLHRRLRWKDKTDEYVSTHGDRIMANQYYHPDW